MNKFNVEILIPWPLLEQYLSPGLPKRLQKRSGSKLYPSAHKDLNHKPAAKQNIVKQNMVMIKKMKMKKSRRVITWGF